jgi:radical SAM superfamily enzyme YgiQ (UPF0313 family)
MARWFPLEMRVPPPLPENTQYPRVCDRQVLLLNPFYAKDPHGSFGKHVLTPTLALTSLAAATPEAWQVVYWDENLLQGTPPISPMPQVVGITVHLTFARRAYELAAWYRKGGAVVILGGPHVTSCPEEAVRHADAIAIGEGIQLWPQILQDVESGTLQRIYRGHYSSPYHAEPPPGREVLPRDQFLTTTSLMATRGCHNRCTFCYLSTDGLHVPHQRRAVEQVVEEFARDAQPYGVFIDNNLGSDQEYLRLLCQGLAPLEKIWSAAVSVEVAENESLVREMALAGCTGVFVGFETLRSNNLRSARKHSPNPEQYSRLVRVLHDYGIQVNGSFVFGFDHDTPDVFAETRDWIERNRLACATFHILTPYPGTPLFRRLKEEGRLLHTDWDRYDTAHAVFRPLGMTPDELEAGYAWCYRQLFSHVSIWKRRPRSVYSVLPYLAMCYLYKKSNRLWHMLIRNRLTARVWRPFVERTRRRHLRYRQTLAGASRPEGQSTTASVISAGV